MKKNFLYNFLLTGSNFLFPLLTFPYLSRILGADGLGVCNFITSYGQNYIIVAAVGIPVYGIREIARIGNDLEKRSKVFFEILTIHFLFTLFLLLIYIISIFLFDDLHRYKEIALIGGSLILLNVFSIEWLFSGVSNFKYITLRSLLVRLLSLLSIFIFVKSKNDLVIYFIILVVTVLCTASIDVYSAKSFISTKVKISRKGVLSHIKPVTFLGIYMVLTSIYSVLPSTLLGFLSTKASVGYYYGANKIIRMIISVFSTLTTVMVPKVNSIFDENGSKDYFKLIDKSINVVISFGIPITFAVYLLANPLVMLLAGKGFVNSILVIQIMAPVILIVAFSQVFVLLILSVNRKDTAMMLLAAVGMLASLIINILFIPKFSQIATAFSQLIAEGAVMFLAFYLSRKCMAFHFPVKKFMLNILFVMPFAFITYGAMRVIQNNLLLLITSGLVCGLYFGVYQIFILKDDLIAGLLQKYRYSKLNI